MIIDASSPAYQMRRRGMSNGRFNGAYYYSKEIRKFIIPNIKTDRNWVTINIPGFGANHSIVFCHNNLHPDHYDWLAEYKDLIIVVGVRDTVDKLSHLGKIIYLPLPIDALEVIEYRKEHDKDTAYAGRAQKFAGKKVSGDPICDLPREEMLEKMSHYKRIYAVGRTAIEARLLGAEVLVYDERYKDPSIWKALDYEGAVILFQKALDDCEAGANYIDCTEYEEYEELVV